MPVVHGGGQKLGKGESVRGKKAPSVHGTRRVFSFGSQQDSHLLLTQYCNQKPREPRWIQQVMYAVISGENRKSMS